MKRPRELDLLCESPSVEHEYNFLIERFREYTVRNTSIQDECIIYYGACDIQCKSGCLQATTVDEVHRDHLWAHCSKAFLGERPVEGRKKAEKTRYPLETWCRRGGENCIRPSHFCPREATKKLPYFANVVRVTKQAKTPKTMATHPNIIRTVEEYLSRAFWKGHELDSPVQKTPGGCLIPNGKARKTPWERGFSNGMPRKFFYRKGLLAAFGVDVGNVGKIQLTVCGSKRCMNPEHFILSQHPAVQLELDQSLAKIREETPIQPVQEPIKPVRTYEVSFSEASEYQALAQAFTQMVSREDLDRKVEEVKAQINQLQVELGFYENVIEQHQRLVGEIPS